MNEPTKQPPREFEVGPIRPPSEAASLLVRVTRNCPWNRCTFCPVYKGERFSLRASDEVKADIDTMASMAAAARALSMQLGEAGAISNRVISVLLRTTGSREAAQVGFFLQAGGRTAFLQDANSLLMKVEPLEDVLKHLKRRFPSLRRVTTYARSHTARLREIVELQRLRKAGLNRIHIGLESGSDAVLKLVDKGVNAAKQIEAGRRVKAAGIELSEYVMPGLGGAVHSEEHARETARVLREIDPDFIRLRSLVVPPGSLLERQVERGELELLDEVGVIREIRSMVSDFVGMTGAVRSDHIMNLLEEVEGQLPDDLPRMLAVIDAFLDLSPDDRELFVIGRRLGIVRRLADLEEPKARASVEAARLALRERFEGPIEQIIRQVATGFV